MLTRRRFGLYTISACASSIFSPITLGLNHTLPIQEDNFPPLPIDLADAENENDFFSPQLDSTKLGRADPGKEKKEKARAIMDAAPMNCRPIDVANFYRDLGRGKSQFGEEGRPYARGWPREYNPVIIEFFKATGLNPLAPEQDGDDTPWCAAFVNYCIARAMSKDGRIGSEECSKGSKSASSGSFRCFGEPQVEPKEGDIAVWALEGTIDRCKPGKGHVGFFVGLTGEPNRPYLIMGGNQSGDLLAGTLTRKDGAFAKAMPMRYSAGRSYKNFFGFRTTNYL